MHIGGLLYLYVSSVCMSTWVHVATVQVVLRPQNRYPAMAIVSVFQSFSSGLLYFYFHVHALKILNTDVEGPHKQHLQILPYWRTACYKSQVSGVPTRKFGYQELARSFFVCMYSLP